MLLLRYQSSSECVCHDDLYQVLKMHTILSTCFCMNGMDQHKVLVQVRRALMLSVYSYVRFQGSVGDK
ncbi:hypothetical protein L1987_80782 [Smallanthus sonchifolius]|uniref:Uncharacterized protein n=1 Tax=Smallanthus sonchifolius TaxID=185202 RepID=A0ACB8YPB9_9ASTR|nr:hypothetical protein L1987_80782 [Smallanthus sonchifolius]